MNPNSVKTKVIVNPDSKPKRIRDYLTSALHVLREHGFVLSVYYTSGPGEAMPAARSAVEHGFEALVVAGGDGTINEAINGIVKSDIPIGLLPFGGSNVLARELNIPMNPIEAARILGRKRVRRMDLGKIGDRYFSMMASCGYDAYAISRTERKLKKIMHSNAYLWAGIKDFIGYRPNPIQMVVDGGRMTDIGTFVVVANSHLYGGPHEVTPFAEIDDGFFDVVIYKGKYQFGLARFAIGVLSKQHLNMRHVKYYRAKSVKLTAEKHTFLQIDGDLLGQLPMTVDMVPCALKVYY